MSCEYSGRREREEDEEWEEGEEEEDEEAVGQEVVCNRQLIHDVISQAGSTTTMYM